MAVTPLTPVPRRDEAELRRRIESLEGDVDAHERAIHNLVSSLTEIVEQAEKLRSDP